LLDTDLVITVDADTWLAPTAIGAIRQAFEQEAELMAACGVLTPRCVNTWSGRAFMWFQTYEYIRAFLSRAAWMQSKALLLVSGAFAAYRRDMLQRIGGYNRNSLVEDYELIHRLHRYAGDHDLDWRVRVLPDAQAKTDAPATIRTFLHQRRRWFAGFLKTQFEYRAMHGNARYGAVGKLMLPIKEADTLQPVFGITAFILLIIFMLHSSPFKSFIFFAIGGKLLVDFVYHMWAIRLYHRWVGRPVAPNMWLMATLSTLAEPFCFQILRHMGAVWGWITLFTGQREWIIQRTAGEAK
jgi:cellulose synthase/poly-beta-1,6-N-acetylglucosamine synthase-like glycosyltransferase